MTCKSQKTWPLLVVLLLVTPACILASPSHSSCQPRREETRLQTNGETSTALATMFGDINEFFLNLKGQSSRFTTMQDTILEDIFSNLRAFSGTTLDIQGLRLFLNLNASGITIPGLGAFAPTLLGVSIGGLHLSIDAKENYTTVRFGISGLGLFLGGSFGNITAATSGALMNLRVPNSSLADYQLFALGPVDLTKQLAPTPTPVPTMSSLVMIATLLAVAVILRTVKRTHENP